MKSAYDAGAEVEMRSLMTQLFGWSRSPRREGAGMLAAIREKSVENEFDVNHLTQALAEIIDALDRLNRDTEQGFLDIGAKIFDFIKEIDLISSYLTELVESQNGARTSQALSDTLACSLQMRDRYSRHVGVLGSLHQELGGVKSALSGFHGTVATFDALRFLTQIELARLGNSGAQFGNLPDEMKSVAANVRMRIDNALEIADSLLLPLKGAIQEMSAIQEGEANDLPVIISETVASLSSLRATQDAAREAAVRLGASYRAASEAFKRLIVSIQFHDITRQQVEHVIETLNRVRSDHRGNDGAAVEDSGTAMVLDLQASQLANAGEKFAASVAAVTGSLKDLEQHVTAMAEESRMLSGSSLDAKESLWIDLERGCNTILGSLHKQARFESSAAAIGGMLEEMIGRVSGSVGEIQAIENQMHLMALNANICAVSISTSGDALGSLAGSMQEKSCDIRQRSESLVKALDWMREGVTSLTGRVRSGSEEELSSQSQCAEEMSLATAELHSSSERSFAQISQIAARGASLGEELSAARECFVVGDLFAEVVGNAQQKLRVIGESSRSGPSQRVDGTSAPALAAFVTNYTMQAERDVHEGIIRGLSEKTSVDSISALAESRSVASDDLGENVELF